MGGVRGLENRNGLKSRGMGLTVVICFLEFVSAGSSLALCLLCFRVSFFFGLEASSLFSCLGVLPFGFRWSYSIQITKLAAIAFKYERNH